MNLPKNPDQIALSSMRRLDLEPGEVWTKAKTKMCTALVEDGNNMVHVFQALLGERIDANDPRYKRWGESLILPVALKNKDLIALHIEQIAIEIIKQA